MSDFYLVHNNQALTVCKKRNEALQHAKKYNGNVCCDSEQLAEHTTTTELVNHHNNMAAVLELKPVKEFKDKKTAAMRLWNVIKSLVVDPDDHLIEEAAAHGIVYLTAKEQRMTEKETKQQKPKAEKRSRLWTKESKIYKNYEKNPRREGTHGHSSWEKIKEGMTVAEYVAAGGRIVDMVWELNKNRLILK